ncbi:MAG: hypothetical protein BWY31_02294 [Lentisphaerae bacterium ADurb.Bin242]|nr:MAG: hypothetical protein BWY31_02294 [Lentisphaerae bacterium ADurb.Bin242]
MFFRKKFLYAVGLGLFTAFNFLYARESIFLNETPQNLWIERDGFAMNFGAKKSNYIVSSLQMKQQVFLSRFSFLCQTSDGKTEDERSVPAENVKETVRHKEKGKLTWVLESKWKFLNLKRTVALGDFPGVKVTYEFEVTEDFRPRRLYLSFYMPQEKYRVTGYKKNSVTQFRKAVKSEWFGILRSPHFPYITFSDKDVEYGLMILAADVSSWERLPGMLLYSTVKDAYSSTEFMYYQNQDMKKGMKGSFSFYLIPVPGKNAAVEADEIYARLKDTIR